MAVFNSKLECIKHIRLFLFLAAINLFFGHRKQIYSRYLDIEKSAFIAFYDGRGNPVITVIVIVKADRLDEKLESDRYSCIADPSKKYLSASLEYITEPNWGYKYKGGFIRCNLTKTEKPKAISIVLHSQIKKNRNFTPKIKLTVQYPSKFLRNFTRCVPAFYNFTDQNALIQMLESDLMFGMNHFIMYNYTGMTPKIQQILKSYQDEGVLTLLQWNLPVLKKDIHYFGQMSNMHECILRNMYVSKYVFIADVDEIVVSDMFSSWQSMTSSILSKHPNCGAISFRNAFFPIIFKDGAVDFPGKTIARKMGLTFLLKTTRTKLHTIGDRSKLLVRPETIHQMGIHGVQKFLNSKMTTCPVNNPKDALLHHYRFKKASDMRSPYTDDHTFQKYSNELISRVQKRFQKIKTTSVT
ncbi:hypothetical protein LOTGIDRAFT_166972 [Lottia gigantea]|uniref:Glycosyltransferase family 92 protein n=1 Tax=Lottia gigantea TaxID=225164 RepID=V3ZQR6_LOTGI|nr:hypothetical protein LOTGIDRAFT_166972 [Lottia gigantea]ESO86697.1 hypothetical protein LOTGIDRAFT_166972 [Lottia gigantea]